MILEEICAKIEVYCKNEGRKIKMKQTIKIILVAIMAVLAITTMVKAATPSEELVSYIKTEGGSYISNSNMVKIERYFKDYPVSASEAEQIKGKIKEAKAVVQASGVKDLNNLSKEDKEKLKSIANEVAAIINVNLVFKNGSVEIYKNGKLIENVYFSEKLSYTGNKINILGISTVAIFALATGVFLVRKKKTVEA